MSDGWIVVRGNRVGHRRHSCKTASHCCTAARSDCLGFFSTWLAQVYVHIEKAGGNNLACRIKYRNIGTMPIADRTNDSVANEHVGDSIDLTHRIDDSSVFHKQVH